MNKITLCKKLRTDDWTAKRVNATCIRSRFMLKPLAECYLETVIFFMRTCGRCFPSSK